MKKCWNCNKVLEEYVDGPSTSKQIYSSFCSKECRITYRGRTLNKYDAKKHILSFGTYKGLKIEIVEEDPRPIYVAKIHGVKTIFTRAFTIKECEKLVIQWIDSHYPQSKLSRQLGRDR